nr:hypothetical protein [Tanacetum cinerariifolium]
MNNKKRIVNLEYFREMLQISPIIPNQQFDELPFEEEILAFLRELGHSVEIKMITDVEHKDAKKSNEMYYPRFTKVIINFFMTKDQSIPRRNKEYYAITSGDEPPKTKASVRKKQSSYDTTVPPPTKGKRLKILAKVDKPAKEKQPAKSSTDKGADEGTSIIPGVPDVPNYESDDEEISWKLNDQDNDDDEQTDSDNDGDDFVHPKFSTHDEEAKDEESFDPIVRTPYHDDKTNDEDNDKDSDMMNVEGDEGANEEDNADELYRDVNINIEGRDNQMVDVQTNQVIEDTYVTLTPVNPEGIDSIFGSTPRLDVSVSTAAEPPLLSATTLPPPTISIIPHMQQTPAPSPVNVPSRLRDEAQAENEDFLNKLDENMQKIIKEQVKVQVSKILPKIKKTVNEQLEAEVLTHLSNSSKTSYAIAADLSELELKKILIEKVESNKSIHISDEQKNLYKALEIKTSATDDQPVEEVSQHPYWFQKQTKPPTPDSAWNKTLPATHGRIQPWINNLAKKADSRTLFNELMDTPSLVKLEFFLEEVYKVTTDQLEWNNPEGQQYPHDLLKPLPLIPNSQGRRVIPFDRFINNDLEYLHGGASSRNYINSATKTKAADYGHIKWIEDLVPRTMESAQDVYSKRRIIAVTELQIVEWHNYKHLDWITVRRDDDKLYKFKEGDFKRLRIQDIEDMLLLLVQGKLTNFMIDERFAFNVSLRMFTRSIVIQRRVEDLQLGVNSYQNKLNRTKSDTYRLDLKCKEAYTTYSNPRGFIYQNKDKQNRLMRIDELHKFSYGTLNNVRNTLDDRLKGIRMQYLPQTI